MLNIIDKDILVCRYLLGKVNYRSVNEAVDYLFWRVYETNKLRHEFVANWALVDIETKNTFCLICDNPQNEHSSNLILAPRRHTQMVKKRDSVQDLLLEDMQIN